MLVLLSLVIITLSQLPRRPFQALPIHPLHFSLETVASRQQDKVLCGCCSSVFVPTHAKGSITRDFSGEKVPGSPPNTEYDTGSVAVTSPKFWCETCSVTNSSLL